MSSEDSPTNDGERFDRLPATADDRVVEGRATRREVVGWWVERFGLDRETFAGHTFWEKGAREGPHLAGAQIGRASCRERV